jgi:oligogalacturonide transporter
MIFINQTCIALGSVFIGLLLDWSGFVKSASGTVKQPESAQFMIVFTLSGVVGLLIIIALISALTFKLDKKTFQVPKNELKRLQGNGKMADATPETKRVCTTLAGVDYDSITVWKEAEKIRKEEQPHDKNK